MGEFSTLETGIPRSFVAIVTCLLYVCHMKWYFTRTLLAVLAVMMMMMNE